MKSLLTAECSIDDNIEDSVKGVDIQEKSTKKKETDAFYPGRKKKL